MKKVILLNDTEREGNWGCKTTSKYLKKLFSQNNSEVNSIPISFSSTLKERVSGHLKTIFLVLKLWVFFIFLKPIFKFYFLKLSWNKKYYRLINSADIVVLNGEGTIHVFNRAVSKWMFYLLVSKYIFAKKYHIVNHTFNLDTKAVKYITYDAYNHADKIYVREGISKTILVNELNLPINRVKIVGDAAFLVKKEELDISKRPNRKYFTICGNVISNATTINNLAKLVLKIEKEMNLLPVFLVADEKDDEFLSVLRSKVENIISIDNKTSLNAILDVIEHAEFFITGRFHPYVFGLTLNTSTFTFRSNTHKIEGVRNMVKDASDRIHLESVSNDFNVIKNSKVLNEPLDLSSLKDNIIQSYQSL